MSAWLLVVALAWADEFRLPISEPFDLPPATYVGPFAGSPFPHWSRELPGKPLNAASHTERTRPVLSGGSIFIGSASGDALYQLDRRSGAFVRKFPASASVESEPVVIADRVFFADTGGHTWCYLLDGTLVWDHDSAAPVLAPPTVLDGRVYVANVDNLVVALDATTGQMIWRHQQPPDVTRTAELTLYAAPRVVASGDVVLAGFSDGALVALVPATGDVRWEARIGGGRYPDLVATPTLWRDLVFASGYDQPLIAFDLATKKVAWEAPYGSSAEAIVVGEGDEAVLLHPGTDGRLRALTARSGLEKWTWNSGDDGSLSAPVLTPAGVLVASSEGTVTLLDVATGAPKWAFNPPYVLDGVTSAPAVDGRQLVFVTNAGTLHSMLAPSEPPVWPRLPERKPRAAGR